MLKAGNDDIAERIGSLLRLADGVGQTIDAVFDLDQRNGHHLHPMKAEIRIVQLGIGIFHAVTEVQLLFRIVDLGDLHAHHAVIGDMQTVVYRNGFREIADDAKGDVGFLQRLIRRLVGLCDLLTQHAHIFYLLHHLAGQDIALAVHQLIAHGGQRIGLLCGDQVALGRKDLLVCHRYSPGFFSSRMIGSGLRWNLAAARCGS